jgi:hypothetical protein
MTRDDDFIGQLEGYLDEYEGSTPLPGDIRNAIRAQLPSIQQRPAWWPARRFPSMNNTAKLALGAAAVVVAAFLGIRFLLPGDVGLGGPDPTPTPTPTPAVLSGDELEAGTYQVTHEGVAVATLTVPDGWFNVQDFGVGKDSNENGFTAVLIWPPGDFANVYLDPCRWQDGQAPVGPTVDDLATALDNQAQRGDSAPVDVSIDGYSGKMIELTVPSDINITDCDAGEFRSWEGRFHQGPGQVDQIYILDVAGQRLVIDTHFLPGTSEADRAERQAIVDSIQIDVP